MLSYLTLFIVSFLSATILPSQSELFLSGLVIFNKHSILILLAIASIGNILGSITNYYIGIYLIKFENTKFIKKNSKNLELAKSFYNKYGKITLFFAWVPIIGDPLTLIAGFFRTNFFQFIVIVSLGKIIRYVVVIWLVLKTNYII